MTAVRHYCEITEEEWKDQYQQFVDTSESDRCDHGLIFSSPKQALALVCCQKALEELLHG